MKIRNPFRSFKEYIYDPSEDLKDRAFILFSGVVLCALFAAVPCGLIMREPLSATLTTLIGAMFFALYVLYIYKKKKIRQARIVISVILVFIFFPVIFFTNGGVYGGAPIWLLLGCLYMVMVLDGRSQLIMSILNVIVLIICWIIGYYFPELVMEYSRQGNFIDSIAALIIVSNVIFVMVNYQNGLYKRENELAEKKVEEIEEMSRAQNRFFSSMSHEIRTPINTVLGLNEIILRQEDASEEIRKDAKNIQGAGRMLLALINDILDVSKIEAGKMDIVPVNYSVSSLISEIVNMIWLKAEEKGLRFTVDIDPDVPEILFGDEVRIKQILINLLNNAVKYTKEGSVSLHIECDIPEERYALLKISVSDTGIGIKPEAIPNLFDTFKRVDQEKNRNIEGTGLGLSIVRQLVDLMGGEVTVNSVYLQGSTFYVTIRQGITSDKRIGDINITGVGGVREDEKFEHIFRAPDARILIVDDNEMNLQVEDKLLKGTLMQVDLALSGQEALKLTLHNRYDVIFMDHMMPEMDGIECLEQIRKQKGGLNRSVPVIALTANAGSENIDLYNNKGFDGYLVKPVSGNQLESMLISHLPEDKVALNENSEAAGTFISTAGGYEKKKPVIIATSSMSDLPQRTVKELEIWIIPYTVITNEGVFFDNVDIDSEELVRYMGDDHRIVLSEPPTEEAMIAFFSEGLKKAHHLIYITLSTGNSREYGRAKNAAKTFENVTLVNSELISSATGILVLIASRLAMQGMPVDRIISELERSKARIRGSFVVKNTDVMAKRGRISPFLGNCLNTLSLRPVLRMDGDKLGVGRLLFGSERKCYEKYIKYALPAGADPDTSFVFITYAGMAEEDLVWIEEKLRLRTGFDNIIFQKASAGISSNCGEGTFGIIYMIKGDHNYNISPFITTGSEEDAPTSPDGMVIDQDDIEGGQAKEWYEGIKGIDIDAAIENSGTKEAFLSVLKIYYDTYEAKSGEIQRLYDQKDWDGYIIKVHALKSSSRLVGAIQLGDDAEAIELAGKKGDTEYITGRHDGMMNRYRDIIDELTPIFDEDNGLMEIPEDVLEDAYEGLLEFSQTEEYDLVKMALDSVNGYKLSKEDEERFSEIQNCLMKLDWNGIIGIIQKRTE
ncbi:MAG: DegV family EDD domain-containing protein [Lachnospiraceae bacterium]|nr:DegV family EDD domain-containing protein [Lachnospiraceae bacterium]